MKEEDSRDVAQDDGVLLEREVGIILCASRSPDLTRTVAHWGE